MKRFISCLLLSLLWASIVMSCQSDDYLYPAQINERWGYFNTKGQAVVEPIYRQAGEFSCGVARVDLNGKIGYINKKGKYIIEPNCLRGTDFSDGQAFIIRPGGGIECVDSCGNQVFCLDGVTSAYPYRNGYSSVHKKGEGEGLIDKNGNLVLDYKWDGIIKYEKELDLFRASKHYCDCYVDKQGSVVYSIPQFEPIAMGTYTTTRYSEGLIGCPNNYARHGYTDGLGKIVIPYKFEEVASFSEGLARVKIKGKYGFINNTGAYVIDPQFDYARDFVNGIALVQKGNKYGYIDTLGKFVIAPIFDDAEDIKDDFTPASIDGKAGFINKTGDFVINPVYKTVKRFNNNYAFVENFDGLWGMIDKKGRLIVEFKFNSITPDGSYGIFMP